MRLLFLVTSAAMLLSVETAVAQTVEIGRAHMFECPEAIPSPETRIWALTAWMRDTLDHDPRARDQAVMNVLRHQFLVRHHCTRTLRNVDHSERGH